MSIYKPRAMPQPKSGGSKALGKTFPVETLTEKEVNALVRANSNHAPSGVRNRALIMVLYRGGLRVSEALSLLPKDLNIEDGSLRILRGKGGKARLVALDPGSCAVLEKWMKIRKKIELGSSDRLFCTLAGRPMHRQYVNKMLHHRAEKAGITKRVHPHGLRHTMAAQLAQEGVPVNVIQKALGHTNVRTTNRYLDHIAPQQVLDAMRKRIWQND